MPIHSEWINIQQEDPLFQSVLAELPTVLLHELEVIKEVNRPFSVKSKKDIKYVRLFAFHNLKLTHAAVEYILLRI